MTRAGTDSIVHQALRNCAAHFGSALFFNAFVNLLLLAYPIYMISVFDRGVSGKRVETIIALFIGFVLAICAQGIFLWTRGALLARASVRLDRQLANRVFATLIEQNGSGRVEAGSQPLRDLDSFRQFATGRGAIAAIDAPWAALFVGVLLAMDFHIGLTTLVGLFLIGLATIAHSFTTRRLLAEANTSAVESYTFVEGSLRGAEPIVGMGLVNQVVKKWRSQRDVALATQIIASERGVLFNAGLVSLHYIVMGAILAVGAAKVIYEGAPVGLVFGAVIISQYAMRPVEQLIEAWEGYVSSREGLRRLDVLLNRPSRSRVGMVLPRPSGTLAVNDLYYSVSERLILRSVNLLIPAGESLGIIGLAGSGKTTLARLITGNLKPSRGSVRLDGADLWSSDRSDLGRYIGYLPQQVGLLKGTVAENIGRFGLLSENEVVTAADAAGAQETILKLPLGYDTIVGEGGHPLSGGQRQLIGLARAIAGKPSIVVLDEPNSNLDGPSEAALISCLGYLKQSGTTTVMITHKPTLVKDFDHMVVLREGAVVSAGPTADVLQSLGRPVLVRRTSDEAG